MKNPADLPDERIGTLAVNPGGPGASGVRRVARGFQITPEVADRFDIVGFDPRGIGESTPITCGGDGRRPSGPPTWRRTRPRRSGRSRRRPGGGRRVRRHRGRSARPPRQRGGGPRHRGDPPRPRRGPDQLRRALLRHAARPAVGGVVPRRRCGPWCSTAWWTPAPSSGAGGSVAQAGGVDASFDVDGRRVRRRPDVPAGRRRRAGGGATTSWPGASRPATVSGHGVGPDPARLRGVLGDLRPGDLAAALGGGRRRARRATSPASPTWRGSFTRPGRLRAVRHRVVPRRPPPGRVTTSGRRAGRRSCEASPRFGRDPRQRAAPLRVLAAGHPRARRPVDAAGRAADPRRRQHRATPPRPTRPPSRSPTGSTPACCSPSTSTGTSPSATPTAPTPPITRYLVDLTVPAAGTRC